LWEFIFEEQLEVGIHYKGLFKISENKNLLKITGCMLLGKLQAVKTFYNVCTKMRKTLASE